MWQRQFEGDDTIEDEPSSEITQTVTLPWLPVVMPPIKSSMPTEYDQPINNIVKTDVQLADGCFVAVENTQDISVDVSLCDTRDTKGLSPTKSFTHRGHLLPNLPQASLESKRFATRLIKHARYNKVPNERDMFCADCNAIPRQPITGPCGHTRCTKCIQEKGACPCGTPAPSILHVNILIKDIVDKINGTSENLRTTGRRHLTYNSTEDIDGSIDVALVATLRKYRAYRRRRRNTELHISPRLPMSSKSRFEVSRQLLVAGRYREAAAHLARIAAESCSDTPAKLARTLLAKIIEILRMKGDSRRIARELLHSVRIQGASSWLRPSDLECVLCFECYKEPVTTLCGHTYCRSCIKRVMAHTGKCPLCSRTLDNADLVVTRETAFVCAALASINALRIPQPQDALFLPIFLCTVAFPGIPCPLLILESRCCLMVRQVLQSGSRKIGMVPQENDGCIADYGTVLEVRDCVELEDGRCIVSTMGVGRFRVLERDGVPGFAIARIETLSDSIPVFLDQVIELLIMSKELHQRATTWLGKLDLHLRTEIEEAFGSLPNLGEHTDYWWETPHGPTWLWWLASILPLPREIKKLVLSSTNLSARMNAINLIMDRLDH